MEPICSEHLLCLELDISSLEVWNISFVWNTCLDISKETIVRMLVRNCLETLVLEILVLVG